MLAGKVSSRNSWELRTGGGISPETRSNGLPAEKLDARERTLTVMTETDQRITFNGDENC